MLSPLFALAPVSDPPCRRPCSPLLRSRPSARRPSARHPSANLAALTRPLPSCPSPFTLVSFTLVSFTQAISQLVDNRQQRPVTTVPNVSADTLARLLDFIYTDNVALNGDNVIDIFTAASTYGLTRLQQLATVYVRDNVTTDNVLPMLQAANRVKAGDLEKFLFKFFQTPERCV